MIGAVPLNDRGLLLGDGLFETLLVEDGFVEDWQAHMDRLVTGCHALGLPAPDLSDLAVMVGHALAGRTGRLALRLTLTAGSGGRGLDRPEAPAPEAFATVAPAPTQTGPVTLAIASVRRNDRSPAARLKTLSYLDNILARAEARAAGAEEAVMLNTQGEVACTAAGNLFWIAEQRLVTPSLDCGVLDGIMRRRVLATARRLGVEVVETRAGPEAIFAAEAVFVTNSLIGVRPAALDGEGYRPHSLLQRLADEAASPALT